MELYTERLDRVCFSCAVEALRNLIPGSPTLGRVSVACSKDDTWLSRKISLRTWSLREDDVAVIEEALRSVCEGSRSTHPGEEWEKHRAQVSALLKVGLRERARAVSRLFDAGTEEPAEIPRGRAKWEGRLKEEWAKSPYASASAVPDVPQVISLVKPVWKDISKGHSGFIYLALGDFLRKGSKAERNPGRAAEFYLESERLSAELLVRAVTYRAKCYGQVWSSSHYGDKEREEARREATRVFESIEIFGSVYDFGPKQRAEVTRAYAEWVRLSLSAPDETVDQQPEEARHLFRKAAILFSRARMKGENLPKSGRPERSSSHLWYLEGYCWFGAGEARARDCFDSAIADCMKFAGSDGVKHMATNFYYLALSFEADRLGIKALWCARAAQCLREALGERPHFESLSEVLSAVSRIQKADRSNGKGLPVPPFREDGEAIASYASRVVADWKRLKAADAQRRGES